MMKKSLRIPLMGFNMSGGIRVIILLANWLANAGWTVEIVIPDYYQTISPFPLDPKVNVRVIKTFGWHIWRRIWYVLRLFWVNCRNIDVCMATSYLTPHPIYISWWLHRRKTTLVYWILGYESEQMVRYGPNRTAIIKKILYTLSELGYKFRPFHQVSITNWLKTQVDNGNNTVIPIGIDLKTFHPPTEPIATSDQKIVGVIGRPNPNKGLASFFEATKPFLNRPDVRVCVFTSPDMPLPDGYERIVSGGEDNAMLDFYHQCTIFVYPSRVEGFGLPPLEAMACGTATIITDSGGIREFANSENSIIVLPDDAQKLSEGIQKLLDDDELRAKHIQNGLETAKRFSMENVQQAYLDFFNALPTE